MTWQGYDDSQLDLFTAQEDKAACEFDDIKDNKHRCECGVWIALDKELCFTCQGWSDVFEQDNFD
jgi:hypothetical protein